MKRLVLLSVTLCVGAFAKDCASGDIDNVIQRARAMAAKNRPVEAEKLLEGAWAACGVEISKSDVARRRDFLLDWLDLAARTHRMGSCVKVQLLLVEHVGDLGESTARVAAAKRRCEADRK